MSIVEFIHFYGAVGKFIFVMFLGNMDKNSKTCNSDVIAPIDFESYCLTWLPLSSIKPFIIGKIWAEYCQSFAYNNSLFNFIYKKQNTK
jgi:hypothetical protein